ncbi:uncharacterized protein LACBIDRAFT_316811 [Laccaria bicolor S238N-H82]|uniref:Predicted protein n=1 Tax=Laccaria bicolor (strain S238N-H82 / ATCC MYA-4686) TaxID=486041 RepID=B0E1N7_LACBS|nr:uncharacterized protein LACBIDRAFT_316811 [Laccaria bicolor S238N-H82]EDQ99226.1 predicted protein [Laccaria bicolor S238N-H82]|eukprot:XP_001890123.1 predicted protein [Laccaria bicolor S238N-H82]
MLRGGGGRVRVTCAAILIGRFLPNFLTEFFLRSRTGFCSIPFLLRIFTLDTRLSSDGLERLFTALSQCNENHVFFFCVSIYGI